MIKPKLEYISVFAIENEVKLVDYACNQAEVGNGFGKKKFLLYAGYLAKNQQLTVKHG